MAVAVDSPAEIEVLAQRDEPPAVATQGCRICSTRSRIHAYSAVSSLVGRVSKDGSTTL